MKESMRDKRIVKDGELSDSDDEGDNRKHEESFKDAPSDQDASVDNVRMTEEDEAALQEVINNEDENIPDIENRRNSLNGTKSSMDIDE